MPCWDHKSPGAESARAFVVPYLNPLHPLSGGFYGLWPGGRSRLFASSLLDSAVFALWPLGLFLPARARIRNRFRLYRTGFHTTLRNSFILSRLWVLPWMPISFSAQPSMQPCVTSRLATYSKSVYGCRFIIPVKMPDNG
mgnify:CR=1 FL=1